jgi:hypothetical protein
MSNKAVWRAHMWAVGRQLKITDRMQDWKHTVSDLRVVSFQNLHV